MAAKVENPISLIDRIIERTRGSEPINPEETQALLAIESASDVVQKRVLEALLKTFESWTILVPNRIHFGRGLQLQAIEHEEYFVDSNNHFPREAALATQPRYYYENQPHIFQARLAIGKNGGIGAHLMTRSTTTEGTDVSSQGRNTSSHWVLKPEDFPLHLAEWIDPNRVDQKGNPAVVWVTIEQRAAFEKVIHPYGIQTGKN